MKMIYKVKEANEKIIGRKVNVLGLGMLGEYTIKSITLKEGVKILKDDIENVISIKEFDERNCFIKDVETKEFLNYYVIEEKEVADINKCDIIKITLNGDTTIIGKIVDLTKYGKEYTLVLNEWFDSKNKTNEGKEVSFPFQWFKDCNANITVLE